MAGGANEKSLEQTPTWAVATVCTVFVVMSLLVERGIFSFGRYLKRNKQKELFHTLEVIKNELMLLGFVSLFLTVFQPKITSICMSERLNHFMLPCAYQPPPPEAPPPAAPARRLLAEGEPASAGKCKAGLVQVISASGLHELHIFIFVLAVVHVLYSCSTVLLGLWQVHSWKKWEDESRLDHRDHHSVEDALGKKKHKKATSNFATKRISYSFLKETRTGLNLDSYIYCFFRQFGKPIYKLDYMSLRLGFIAEHRLAPTFDFHSYIRRTVEDDFKVVVGISWYLWAFVCLFLLMDIYGWYTYFWMAFIPTLTVLIVGMKLQQIITTLAIEVTGGLEKKSIRKRSSKPGRIESDHKISADNVEEEEIHPIKPRDDLFWFDRPRLLLYLVHFMLFQNAFEFAYFFWGLFTYGFRSCLVGKQWMIIVRLVMGVIVQILCSVSTLPLYAIVSKLGSKIKMNHALSEKAQTMIHNWRDKATQRAKAGEVGGESSAPGKDLDHSVDIELPRSNGHHANHATDGHGQNGLHHPHSTSHDSSISPPESHTLEIQEQGSK